MFSCVRNIIFEKLLKLLNLSSNYSQKMSGMFFIGTQCSSIGCAVCISVHSC